MNISIVILYVLANLAVGWWAMRKNKNVSDFFLGGRNIGPWMSAFAYGTTYFSAVLFVGYAGRLGWGYGLSTMWIVAGNVIFGSFLAWMILGGPTRLMTVRLNALTMPEFLEARYGAPALKAIGAVLIFCLLLPYSASVYTGLAYLFETTLGINETAALASLAVITGLYLIMGGYFALTLTDFIRGLVEIVGVIVMVLFLVSKVGGFSYATSALVSPEFMPALHSMPKPIELDNGMIVPGWLILSSLVFVTSLGPWGLPQMVQKFYSIKNAADIKRTMWVASAFALLIAFGAYYTGSLTHLFYDKLPAEIIENGKPNLDKLMPIFLLQQTPQWVSVVILLLIFSASMCSLSSLVLVSASAIVIDLLGRSGDCGKGSVGLMRVFCALFVALSLSIAIVKPTFIMNLMVMSWGSLSGCFLAPYVYGLFWKRATKAAAYSSFVVGVALSATLWFALGKPGVPIAGAVTMLASLIIFPIVSALSPAPSGALVERAFGTAGEISERVSAGVR